jgi:signal transduction histidine kinase
MSREDYDICLLDYFLGARSGLEILNEARRKGLSMPVILLTGQGEYDIDLRAMRAGAADYLVKDHLSAPLLERSIRYAVEHAKTLLSLKKAYEEMEQKVQERTAELAAANEVLRHTSERIKLFAYSVLHDLKNPAIGIFGLARRLNDQYRDGLDDKGREYCARILRASEEIAKLVEQINLYISTKELPLRIESIDLEEIYRSIRDEFAPELRARAVELSGPEMTSQIRADRLAVLRVLRNLVDNALKYGGKELKKIAIEYLQQRDRHVISVEDDGVGLRDGDSEKMFGMFFRRVTSKDIPGAGLGLAIVREIAELHGGTVWAETGVEKGVRVHFSIPKS